ncbi:hypothetical protein NA57DRAFT_58523 [Rhizodiscina lignyota]|uniref:Zn(2)-C6 fungal-type domain-containing protein n=1 Tax=Rhizodiscina lignyota TaxID=1504668 RepID=A0A9P4I7U8_9PEZI|nr:hypothetical protein NA57DRAFT_58523 [Rhizodiscina lignyota]
MPEKRSNGEGEGEELELALNPARSYPRKRVAVACEVCRLRKTRCDAKRPCGFCTEAGIECVYRQQNPTERQSAATDILTRIEERLARLEDSLHVARSESANTPGSHKAASNDVSVPYAARSRSYSAWRNYYQQVVAVPSHEFSFRQTAGEAVTARPSIISFHSPYYISYESWDDTSWFYNEELTAEEHLNDVMESYMSQPVHPSARTAWHLQQAFVLNFLHWHPVLDVDVFVEHCKAAQASDYNNDDASTCLTMLAFAIAEMSDAQNSSPPLDPSIDQYLGLHYFRRGCQILEQIKPKTRRSIIVMQCRFLRACYFLLCPRPVLAFDAVSELARDLMHLLSSGWLDHMPTKQKEGFHRVFWTCSVLLHELEAVLKTHPIGLRQFHEVVPLPFTDVEEEDGFFYFFAQASLRKLLADVLDVVGYRVGQVIYAPVVAAELKKQALEWYEHLPVPVRFPVNASPLFDLRKSFLRFQYLAMHTVIYWPSVLQFLETKATRAHEHLQVGEHLRSVQQEAQDCIDNCVLCCEAVEELLMQRHLGFNFAIWASYATMCMLLITYRAPGLGFIPATRNETHIRKAFNSLRPWSHLSVVGRGLERVAAQMQKAHIDVDNASPVKDLPILPT